MIATKKVIRCRLLGGAKMKALLAKKVGMTQIFNEDGVLVPVTVLEAGPCKVTQVKTEENDGYTAVQIGFVDAKDKHTNKPMQGHFNKAGVEFKRHLKEFKLEGEFEVGQELKADVFAEGDKIDVRGTSKGKGFQGAIKRHGFSIGPKAHGSKYHRSAGSMGNASFPGRVFKGKKLAGHMGAEIVTVQNLEVVKVMPEKNLLLVKGSIPGPKKAVVEIRSAVKGN